MGFWGMTGKPWDGQKARRRATSGGRVLGYGRESLRRTRKFGVLAVGHFSDFVARWVCGLVPGRAKILKCFALWA